MNSAGPVTIGQFAPSATIDRMHYEILFAKVCPRLLPLIAILFFIRAVGAADQPQWGQRFSRNMISGERGLPESFDPATGKNIRWTAKIGSQSYATPIVANGKVFIGTNNNSPRDPRHQGDRGVLMCFDEKAHRRRGSRLRSLQPWRSDVPGH